MSVSVSAFNYFFSHDIFSAVLPRRYDDSKRDRGPHVQFLRVFPRHLHRLEEQRSSQPLRQRQFRQGTPEHPETVREGQLLDSSMPELHDWFRPRSSMFRLRASHRQRIIITPGNFTATPGGLRHPVTGTVIPRPIYYWRLHRLPLRWSTPLA